MGNRSGSSYGRGGSYGGSYGGGSYGGGYGMNPMAVGTQPAVPGQTPSFTDRLRNIINRASPSGEVQVLGETKIIADERTNSLLIFATKEDMKVIKDIVSKLDVVLAQVLIEAVILEVQLGPNTKDFGISYLQHPQSSGDVTGVGAIGQPFYRPGDFISGGGTNAGSALRGGFNYLASFGQDLDVTLTAIATQTKAKVLQRPRIQTSHAVQAQLFVGESRPYPTGSYYGGGAYGSYSSIQQLQIGVTLDVTPLINPDGLVVMDIHQTIENYAGFTEITGVGQVPNTTRKEAGAKVAVRDRDTIILGGLIEDNKNSNGSGVPFLMNIPVLGYLFRSTQTSETRKELIVLIRPTVLPTPEVAALTARSEKDRMPGVRRAEAEFEVKEQKEQLKSDKDVERILNSGDKKPQRNWVDQ
jgi:general secretion pathway protein D